jgi:peptide chain release factor subunit 1
VIGSEVESPFGRVGCEIDIELYAQRGLEYHPVNKRASSAPPTTNHQSLAMSAPAPDAAEQNIQLWKMRKLIKQLDAARGAGTSMISLVIPPKSQISQFSTMLTQEYGTASNIKSRVNRLSVLAAITSTQQRLKLYNRVPPNGLVLFVGTILTDEGKEKKVSFDFEPHKPINTSLYLCDNKFHTEVLQELLESDSKFGFIVMDGNGTVSGVSSALSSPLISPI